MCSSDKKATQPLNNLAILNNEGTYSSKEEGALIWIEVHAKERATFGYFLAYNPPVSEYVTSTSTVTPAAIALLLTPVRMELN